MRCFNWVVLATAELVNSEHSHGEDGENSHKGEHSQDEGGEHH